MHYTELPRERLLKLGPSVLSVLELLSLLLATGYGKDDYTQLAKKVFALFENSSQVDVHTLLTIRGVGPAKASRIVAALELAKRLEQPQKKKIDLSSAKKVFSYIYPQLKDAKKEHVLGLFVDTKNKLIKQETIFIGTLHASIIHPREIFYEAIKCCAHGVILIHNHPSGDPTPSEQDVVFTKQLFEASKLLQIELVDHIIIAGKTYTSLLSQNFDGAR
jgi:DNA repair protein RadC